MELEIAQLKKGIVLYVYSKTVKFAFIGFLLARRKYCSLMRTRHCSHFGAKDSSKNPEQNFVPKYEQSIVQFWLRWNNKFFETTNNTFFRLFSQCVMPLVAFARAALAHLIRREPWPNQLLHCGVEVTVRSEVA